MITVTTVAALRASHTRGQVRWALDCGHWQALGRGVVVLHSGPVTEAERVWAAVLAGPAGTVTSHGTAAALEGLHGFAPDHVHVTVPAGHRRFDLPGVVVHLSRRLGAGEVHPLRQPPRTRLARSVADLAAIAPGHADARAVLAAAVQQRLVPAAALAEALRNRRPPGLRQLLRDVADIGGGSHSVLELELLDLIRRAGLPPPDRQVRQRSGSVVDAEWRRYGVVIEVDGGAHRDAPSWWSDLNRQNEIVLGDRLVLRFSAHALRETPALVADQLRRALALRGA